MKKKTSVGMADITDLIDRLSDRQRREFALWCAERVRRLMTDPRSTNALDVVARHLRGEATDEELTAADVAAWAAAWVAAVCADADAALAAARAAAWAASRAADRRVPSLAAAQVAARAAAWDAASDAAWDTERAAQRDELRRMLGEKINPASSKKKGRKK